MIMMTLMLITWTMLFIMEFITILAMITIITWVMLSSMLLIKLVTMLTNSASDLTYRLVKLVIMLLVMKRMFPNTWIVIPTMILPMLAIIILIRIEIIVRIISR